jgi:hypothetical protein
MNLQNYSSVFLKINSIWVVLFSEKVFSLFARERKTYGALSGTKNSCKERTVIKTKGFTIIVQLRGNLESRKTLCLAKPIVLRQLADEK